MKKELLEKFLNDKCTESEVFEIIGYFRSEAIPVELKEDFLNTWSELSHEELKPKDWSRVIEDLNLKILVSDLMDSHHNNKGGAVIDNGHNSIETRDRLPAPHTNNRRTRKITLYLTIAVIVGIIGIALFKSPEVNTSATEITLITKTNPKGQKMTIHLNDGSIVILNSNSSLSYPESFPDTLRNIRLTGEAYFEVAEDKSRPFIVTTSHLNVKVLGTMFNVKDYENLEVAEVALASGKVLVSQEGSDSPNNLSVNLEPGEKLVLNENTREAKKSPFDFDEVFSWKNGIIYFSNASFEEVTNKLEDWYGVEFIIEGSPTHAWDFTAKFKNESLKTVLDAIGFAKQFKYELKDKNVYITLNN